MDSERMHNAGQVTNPGAIATSNRRKKLKTTYASAEWERACDEVLNRRHYKIGGIIRGEGLQVGEAGMLVYETLRALHDKVPCEMHLKKGFIVQVGTLFHHSYLESYKDGSYLNLKKYGGKVLCGKCHYAVHFGLDLCDCGGYMKQGADMCRACFDKAHPEIKAEKDAKIKASKDLKKRLQNEEKERVKAFKATMKKTPSLRGRQNQQQRLPQ